MCKRSQGCDDQGNTLEFTRKERWFPAGDPALTVQIHRNSFAVSHLEKDISIDRECPLQEASEVGALNALSKAIASSRTVEQAASYEVGKSYFR